MWFSQVILSAVACFIASTAAHMRMDEPRQWSGVPAASPLAPDGSDFPCQGATPNPVPVANYTAGGTGMLSVTGSAVHGGGSGQMVITYDFPPTAKSEWRVMQSWEGDHPFKMTANFPPDPEMKHPPIPFAIPKELKAGKAVIAWNWFNRIGNREEYMKCATVTIEAPQGSYSAFESLPTMFRANSGNGCIVPENTNAIAFKNPGPNLIVADGYTPTPIDCDSSKPGTSAFHATADIKSSGTTDLSQVKTGNSSVSTSSLEATNGGNDHAIADLPTTYGEPSKNEVPYKKEEPSQKGDSASCVEGTVTCNPNNTWSLCGSGRNQLIGAIPPGLACVNGAMGLPVHVKRSIRFSTEHMRHRH